MVCEDGIQVQRLRPTTTKTTTTTLTCSPSSSSSPPGGGGGDAAIHRRATTGADARTACGGSGDDVDDAAAQADPVLIRIAFTPTVPHCSLATLIGLCMRVKLERNLTQRSFKLDIAVMEGTHSLEEDVNKQINDKERVAAAMENPNLREMVEECIKEPDS